MVLCTIMGEYGSHSFHDRIAQVKKSAPTATLPGTKGGISMIFCSISIDYMSQLDRTGVRAVPSLLDAIRSTAITFGGTVQSKKTPVVASFPMNAMFSGLQTVEALCAIADAASRYSPKLRGVSVMVHDAATLEEALDQASRERLSRIDDSDFIFTPQARKTLSRYFDFSDAGTGWRTPGYKADLADADARVLFERPQLAATIGRALARAGSHGPRLLHMEAGPSARSLAAMAGAMGTDRVLVVSGYMTRDVPFSPLLEAMASYRDPADTQAAGPGPAVPQDSSRSGTDTDAPSPEPVSGVASWTTSNKPAFDLVAGSVFADTAPTFALSGCSAYMNEWLDRFGSRGGIVLCDAPERLSKEAVELIASRLAGGRGNERIVSVSDGGAIEAWIGSWAARVPAGVASSDDMGAACARALGQAGVVIRRQLSDRFEAIAGLGNDSNAAMAILRLLPAEATMVLYAMIRADNTLSRQEFSEFLSGFGLKQETESTLRDMMTRAGLLRSVESMSPVQPWDEARTRAVVGVEVCRLIDEGLARFLMKLYRSGRIRPSIGFLERVGERQDEDRLVFDCLFSEVFRPDLSPSGSLRFLSASSASIVRFWSALMGRNQHAAESALNVAASGVMGPRADAIKALMRSELAYAEGDCERASKGAREALLALGRGAPPKLEARSQRMMGLAALAMGKYTEASDYFLNAQEIAENAQDHYERMMAAYSKLIVEFLMGSVGKAKHTARHASESAQALFRIDMLAAIEALQGRIEMELGDYDHAVSRFGHIASMAETYNLEEVRRRAIIWQGRALGYSGLHGEAARYLEQYAEDDEACVFRGEIEILAGNPRDARKWLTTRQNPGKRRFMPPDTVDWSSLIADAEGRTVGYELDNAALFDYRHALELYARGMDEHDSACAVDLHALTRSERAARMNPGVGLYSLLCYLLEEQLDNPPVDSQTVLSRAFKNLQQRAGRIEDRGQREFYMEKNYWNRMLIEAARMHKFI